MIKTRTAAFALSAGLLILNPASVFGQTYPSKSIRMVVPEAGGGADAVARLIAPAMAVRLGQQIVVDNRGSIVSAEIVSHAPADGYTLLFNGGTLWTIQLLRQVSYDPLKDLAPVTLVASSPNLLVVNPALPVKSVQDLIALAKAKPGALNYASGVTGAPTQIAMEMFKSMAGVNIVQISYRGTGPALIGLMSGQEQVMLTTSSSAAPLVQSGKIRALAVTSAQPSALFPGLPTVASTVPGYESSLSFGLFAPPKAPAAVVDRLHQEMLRVLNEPTTKTRLMGASLDISGGGPQQLAAVMKSEISRIGKVIKEAGIHAE